MVPCGLLNLNKPAGMTSRQAVDVVQRLARPAKAGHAGTLDPLATGLLVICLGAATRLSDYLRDKDKRYRARVRLGQSTNTYDADGEIVSESSCLPEQAAVEAALEHFRGSIQQRPPAFSAIKRGGRKAYELAREGQAVELEARPVEIHALALTDWQEREFTLEVHCASGTYIRALAHDLGQLLGCGAHLTALRRMASGQFDVSEAVTLEALQAAFALSREAWQPYLRPADAAVADWPAVHLSAADAARLAHGQPVPCVEALGEHARAYNPAGEFFAILRLDPTRNAWRPLKVFAEQTFEVFTKQTPEV
jgi:tRNA pseudouridine55 synthase